MGEFPDLAPFHFVIWRHFTSRFGKDGRKYAPLHRVTRYALRVTILPRHASCLCLVTLNNATPCHATIAFNPPLTVPRSFCRQTSLTLNELPRPTLPTANCPTIAVNSSPRPSSVISHLLSASFAVPRPYSIFDESRLLTDIGHPAQEPGRHGCSLD